MSQLANADLPTIVRAFGYSPLAPAIWRTDPATGLDHRDLGLDSASEHALRGWHVRTGGRAGSTGALIPPDSPFAFLFVLQGRVTLLESAGVLATMGPMDSAVRHGGGSPLTVEFSHDAEMLMLRATAEQSELFGACRAGEWHVSHEDESSYIGGDGPRRFFRYRDLGVAKATARRIHIHIVRSTARAEPRGTGWHSHSMGQLFYVLRGWADLLIEARPSVRMNVGDAMCLAARMKHDVPDYSQDYLVLEMCIPADYDTIDADQS